MGDLDSGDLRTLSKIMEREANYRTFYGDNPYSSVISDILEGITGEVPEADYNNSRGKYDRSYGYQKSINSMMPDEQIKALKEIKNQVFDGNFNTQNRYVIEKIIEKIKNTD